MIISNILLEDIKTLDVGGIWNIRYIGHSTKCHNSQQMELLH